MNNKIFNSLFGYYKKDKFITYKLLFFFLFILLSFPAISDDVDKPSGLTVNFLLHPDLVFLDGYPVDTELSEAVKYNENFQFTEITQKQPLFGWILPSGKSNTMQTGYRKIRIKPQPASLETAEIKHPTIRGDVIVSFNNKPNESLGLNVTIPANMRADIFLPLYNLKQKVTKNNKPVNYEIKGDFIVIKLIYLTNIFYLMNIYLFLLSN